MEQGRDNSRSHWMRQRDDTIAASLSWWQHALKLAHRRHGRHYARQVRDAAIADGLIVDTGCVDKPKQQRGASWWPIYIVLQRLSKSSRDWIGHHTYWHQSPARADLACLCSQTVRQALRRNWKPAYGSVQAAFLATGPP